MTGEAVLVGSRPDTPARAAVSRQETPEPKSAAMGLRSAGKTATTTTWPPTTAEARPEPPRKAGCALAAAAQVDLFALPYEVTVKELVSNNETMGTLIQMTDEVHHVRRNQCFGCEATMITIGELLMCENQNVEMAN